MGSERKLGRHAALLASPGMGHIIPFLELGHRLVSRHGFHSVTVFVASTGASASDINLLQPPDDNVHVVTLPPSDMSALVGPATAILVRCKVAIRLSLPALRSAISGLKSRPDVLVVDHFATEAHSVAAEFNMRKYVFFPMSAWLLALTLYVPDLDRDLENRHVIDHEPLSIPGCDPVRFECSFEPVLCRESDPERFSEYVRTGVEISKSDGVLVNTWHDLEPKTIRALADENLLGRGARPRIFPIGPVVRPAKPEKTSRVVEWLDMQPNESVIYVSFGSGGTMSGDQTNEIAWGLELSQHRFIWVARPPVEGDTAATFFAKRTEDGTPDYLPDGFLTRTREMGLVIPKWGPQSEILAHPSVGGFLSHCGWNSTMESLVNGVPMIAWPLYAEQKTNTAMLVEHVGVAVRPEELPTNKVVRREEIEKMVREVMAGDSAMRKKAKELKRTADKALNIGGSSYQSSYQAFCTKSLGIDVSSN